MVEGVSNVWLPVDDMERAKQFYGDTLGISVKEDHGEWTELELDGLTIGLNTRDKETTGGEGGAVLSFRPKAEHEKAVEEPRRKGVEVDDGITERQAGRIAGF